MLIREIALYGGFAAITALLIGTAWYRKQPVLLLAIPFAVAVIAVLNYFPPPTFPLPRVPFFSVSYALLIAVIVANLLARKRGPQVRKQASYATLAAVIVTSTMFIFFHPR